MERYVSSVVTFAPLPSDIYILANAAFSISAAENITRYSTSWFASTVLEETFAAEALYISIFKVPVSLLASTISNKYSPVESCAAVAPSFFMSNLSDEAVLVVMPFDFAYVSAYEPDEQVIVLLLANKLTLASNKFVPLNALSEISVTESGITIFFKLLAL